MPEPLEIVGGIAIGEGIGAAVGDVIVPKLRQFQSEQWNKHPDMPLEVGQVATALIKGFPTALNLALEASYTGFNEDRLGVLEQNLREHPELALALQMWRRGYITITDVDRYLQRHGFDKDSRDAMLRPAGEPGGLKHERLAPAQIALGIVRSIIRDPGLMPVDLDTSGGVVPAYRPSSISALDEAADAGIDEERLRVMVGEIGLPMSAQQAASALFRKIIRRGDYNRAILEGDTRPEWAEPILEQARQILTANQYAELELRGYLDRTTRLEHTDKHGMSHADSDLLYDVLGRAVTTHQVTTGLARGGKYPGSYANVPSPYREAIQRGNLREEYAELAYANRHSYPSAFQVRAETQNGNLSEAECKQILLEMGWSPKWADHFAKAWHSQAGGTGVTADPLVKSARTQAITEIRSAYLIQQADATQADGWLGEVSVPADVRAELIRIWTVMREVPQKGLSASQIRQAYQADPTRYPLTWATAEMLKLGYTTEDAGAYLNP